MIPSVTARSAILGVPLDANKQPSGSGVVRAFEQMDARIIANSAGAIIKNSLANLNAAVSPTAGLMAWVFGDATVANNGVYENTGTSGTPVWTRRGDLPYGYIHAINVGAGTANAIQVTTAIPIPSADGAAEILVPVVTDNTSSTVTLSINGETALPVKTASGNNPAIGGVTGFMKVIKLNSQYRMLSDQASAAIQAAAEVAQAAAEAAAATAQASAGISFATVAALIADTALAYSGGTEVSAGAIVEAGGFRYEVADSGASDHQITTAGGVKLYALPGTDGFDLRQFPVSTGAADNAAAIQSAMTLAAVLNVPLYLGTKDDVWPCTGTVIPTVAGKRLELRGEATLLFSGTGYLNISGTVTDTTYVATAVAKGSRTVVVNDASGLAVGDTIVLEDDTDWSFSASQHTGREAYHAGDFARIAGISTNTLTLENPLRDNQWALATSKVYKANPVELVTSAFSVEASDTPTASAIASVVVGGALNFNVKGGNQYAAFFNKLWKTDGRGGRYIHTASNTGNNYGLVVGNAQDCTFYDVYAYGTRRGIATGTGGGDAGICMRNVKFIGGASDNGDDTLGSADFHGDADDCYYIGHRATFFDVGGRSCKIIDCEVAPRGALDPVSWTELAGGDMVVKNLKVRRPAGATFTGIVSGRNGSQLAAIAENYSFTVDGVTITDGASLVSIVGFLNAAVSPTRSSVFVDNVKILGGAPASNFRVLSSSVSNVASHGAGVAAPVSLEVGDKCVWPFATTHFWMTFSGTHTGCRVWAPSTTFLTAFSVASAASASTAQAFSFVGYPFTPKVECCPFGLTSAAGMLFFGVVDAATASTCEANITTGKSTDTAGADRILSARIEVSMRGAIAA